MALLCLLALAAPVAANGVDIYSAYYRPDPIELGGHVFVYVRNTSSEPTAVTDVCFEGQSVGPVFETSQQFLELGFRDKFIEVTNKEILWYRVFPNPVVPGGISEVVIRLDAKPTEDELPVDVVLGEGNTLHAEVSTAPSAVTLDYVAYEKDLQPAWVFARVAEGQVEGVEVDGNVLTESAAELRPAWKGVCTIRCTLPQPPAPGSLHTFALRDSTGTAVAAAVRAVACPLPLGIMGNLAESEAEQYASHLFKLHLAFVPAQVSFYDRLEQHGLVGSYLYYRRTKPEQQKNEPIYYAPEAGLSELLDGVRARRSVYAYFLEDEPDGRYHHTTLSLGATCRDVERANTFCRIFDPERPTYLQMNHGSYPKCLFRWGQIPDLLSTHAYPLGRDIEGLTRDHARLLRLAAAPKPFFYLACGFTRNDVREYGPNELRLEVLNALGEGAKGILYYPAHSDRGLLRSPAVWREVARINSLLRQAFPFLSFGTPVDAVRVRVPGRDAAEVVRGDSLLCRGDALAVVLTNRTFESAKEKFELPPVRDLTVEVDVPPWMTPRAVFTVNPEGPSLVPFEARDGVVRFRRPRLEAGELILITQSRSDYAAMSGVAKGLLAPKLKEIGAL